MSLDTMEADEVNDGGERKMGAWKDKDVIRRANLHLPATCDLSSRRAARRLPACLAACPACIERPPLHLFYSLAPIHLLFFYPSILALTLSDTNIHSLPPSPSPFANVVNGGISRLIRHVYE